jgi:uracil-DNA glycosylase
MDAKKFLNGVEKPMRKIILSPKILPSLKEALKSINPTTSSPRQEDIMNFSRATTLDKVRVVIVGQDPYPNPDHAHGLSFSTRDSKCPASLVNIIKQLKNSYMIFGDPETYNLTHWAVQGVMMLNMALTTEKGKSGAHMKLWRPITNAIIEYIGSLDRPIVWMLWGGAAKKVRKLITSDKAIILEATHPSPLSQNRLTPADKFENLDHFTQVNAALGNAPIDWSLLESKMPSSHEVYTDGACKRNGKPDAIAGYGAIFTKGNHEGVELWGRVPPLIVNGKTMNPTNIRAEGIAIIRAIEYAANQPITIKTDSDLWVKMMYDHVPKWVKNGIPFTSKANVDIVTEMWNLFTARDVKLVWVRGHSKVEGADKTYNDMADALANVGCKLDDDGARVNLPTPH